MRDLNKEYKDMVLNETPDIWSRIEAGLDERQKTAGPKAVAAPQAVTIQPQVAAAPKRKVFKITRMMKYVGGAVAAVVCICIVLPLLRGGDKAATIAPSSATHVRNEAAADSAGSMQAMSDMAETAEAPASEEASSSRKNAGKQSMSYLAQNSDELDMELEDDAASAATAEDFSGEETAKPVSENGGKVIKITLKEGTDIDSIRYLIDAFSLELYDEIDGTLVFIVPEGTDLKDLGDAACDDENIAESEITTILEGSNNKR